MRHLRVEIKSLAYIFILLSLAFAAYVCYVVCGMEIGTYTHRNIMLAS